LEFTSVAQGGGGAAQYTAATAGEGRADVRLHNPDAELDFEDRVADFQDAEEGSPAGARRVARLASHMQQSGVRQFCNSV